MENELNALEGKLAQLIQMSGKLRAENHQLRQELAHALSGNRQYGDKVESAKARLDQCCSPLFQKIKHERQHQNFGNQEFSTGSCASRAPKKNAANCSMPWPTWTKMREIRDAGKIASVERIALMAALNITHELFSVKIGRGVDLADFKRRIDSMQAATIRH